MNQIYTYKPLDLTSIELPVSEIALIELLTRRRFITGMGGLLSVAALGACSSDESSTEATTITSTTRTITHAFGETEVPLNPQRVVTLDAFFTLTPLIELNVPVVGSVSLGSDTPFPGLSSAEQEIITSVGMSEPNLETIAALNPDLIIAVDWVDPQYEELSQIAPTVVIKTMFDWKAQHRRLGEITGRLDAANEGITRYEERVASLRDKYITSTTVSVLSLSNEAIFPIGPKAWSPIKILDEVGIQRPPDEIVEGDDEVFLPISVELWPEIAGDVLLYTAGYPGMDDATAQAVAEALNNPIWQQIPAVQNGRAYQVDSRCWETFGGLRSANCVLDEIDTFILNEQD
ncbi:MAG: iron-siderophore ABC transporter substrate-binding protein [Chloroflexota bacterium]